MSGPRERMVVSAALLIRERGAHPTAIADVLTHSGAPRGSAYHYFPGGRTQLLCEAIDYASDHVAARIDEATDSIELLDDMIERFCKQLAATGFRAGCPVVAVAVESGDPESAESALVDRAGVAFERWTAQITRKLADDGISAEVAEDLALLVMSAIEGAVVMARATRTTKPLERVRGQLHTLLAAALPDSPDHEGQ